MKNIVSLLYDHADTIPDKISLIHKNKQITYLELRNRIRRCAANLRHRGISEGDRVLVFVPMSIDLYVLLLGLWHLGATAVFLDAWAGKKRLDQAAQIADCKGFVGIFKAHFLRLFTKTLRRIPIALTTLGCFKTESKADAGEVRTPRDKSVALITFTTGSTGIPKAAKRTHAFLLAQHRILNRHLDPDPDDIDLVTLPIFVLTNLAAGITSVIAPFNPARPHDLNPSLLVRAIKDHGVDSSAGSPIIYEKLSRYCIDRQLRLLSLKKIFLGGAPVFPRLAEQLAQAFPGAGIEVVYGSTEAEPISTVSAKALLGQSASVIRSGLYVGRPVPAIDLVIIKPREGPIGVRSENEFQKRVLPPCEVGEICVAGDHVLRTYFRNEQARLENKIEVGNRVWHRTGDAGYLDGDGNLFLMGRLKYRFRYRKQNWYLFSLEEGLIQIPGVDLGTYYQNEGVLTVILDSRHHRPSRKKVFAHLTQYGMPLPDRIVFAKIPRDPRHQSKIDYAKLSEI